MEERNTVIWENLQGRIDELEDRIEALRISRRVLMNLISTIEQENREEVQLLQAENDKLKKDNTHYMNIVMRRNLRIVRLEQQLKQFLKSNQVNT